MYVDYNFYQNTYQGKLPIDIFTKLEIKASGIVDHYTFNRIEEADDKVKFAVSELTDYLAELEATGGKEIASEAVGTHSVTYVNTAVGRDPVKLMQKAIVAKYLAHTGLMYRGR